MPVIVRVSQDRICRIFNKSQYPELIRRKALRKEYSYNEKLSARNRRKTRLPKRTRSQVIRYRDASGKVVVIVHQYRLPDGRLGMSGLPDPKMVRIDETVYLFDQDLG